MCVQLRDHILLLNFDLQPEEDRKLSTDQEFIQYSYHIRLHRINYIIQELCSTYRTDIVHDILLS